MNAVEEVYAVGKMLNDGSLKYHILDSGEKSGFRLLTIDGDHNNYAFSKLPWVVSTKYRCTFYINQDWIEFFHRLKILDHIDAVYYVQPGRLLPPKYRNKEEEKMTAEEYYG